MRKINISLCYHPTTLALIDDNKDYLKHLMGNLNEYPCLPFEKSSKASDYFEHYRHSSFSANCIKEFEEKQSAHLTSAIDIKMIQQEISRKDRFSEIAVAIVDYNMPALNGIELCKKIKKLGIMTILLTGEVEYELAVSAFNKNEIDFFIKKTQSGLKEQLLDAIKQLEKRYFLKQSTNLLSKMPQHILACLSDMEVTDLFYSLCQQNEIVESYLISEKGSFLLVNKAGRPSYLVMANEKDMQTYYNNARIEEAPQIVLDALKNRTMIPFFPTEKDLTEILPTEWERYLNTATRIDSEQTYYYAYINDSENFPLKPNKILTYQQYLKNI